MSKMQRGSEHRRSPAWLEMKGDRVQATKYAIQPVVAAWGSSCRQRAPAFLVHQPLRGHVVPATAFSKSRARAGWLACLYSFAGHCY